MFELWEATLWDVLAGTTWCCYFWKDNHKVRDCSSVAAWGRESKQAPPNSQDVDAPKRNHLYYLQTTKEENLDEGTDNL